MIKPTIGIQETHLNASEGHCIGDGFYSLKDTWLEKENDEPPTMPELYAASMKYGEHGRCIGKVYQDTKDGESVHCGYVFNKRAQYEDTGETYLHETWIVLGKHYPEYFTAGV